MRFFAISLLVTTSFAYTYWIDDSCNRYPGVARAVDEAILMAQLSYQRLKTPDPDFSKNFLKIFNTTITDPEPYQLVRRIMYGIGTMGPQPRAGTTSARSNANMRIYCDEGSRWELQPDRERITHQITQPHTNLVWEDDSPLPNSQRRPEDQIWIDRANGIITNAALVMCADGNAIAYTANVAIPRYHDEIEDRNTMTICSPFTEPEYPTLQSLMTDGIEVCLIPINSHHLGSLLSITVLHEFTHMSTFHRTDVGEAYSWDVVTKMSTADGIQNAENYAYLGLLAILELAGCKLVGTSPGFEEGKIEPITYFHTPRGAVMDRRHLVSYGYGAYRKVPEY